MQIRPAIWRLGMTAGDVALAWASFMAAYWLRFSVGLGVGWGPIVNHPPAPPGEYLKALLVVSYVWVFSFQVLGLYDRRRLRQAIDETNAILKGVTFGTLVILSITFFYRGFDYSRVVIVYAWLLNSAAMILFRNGVRAGERRLRRRGIGLTPVLLVGSGGMAAILADKIRARPELGYQAVGFVDGPEHPAELAPGIPFLGRLGELEQVARQAGARAVLVGETDLPHYRLLEIIAFCESHGFDIHMVPTVFDLVIEQGDLHDLDGLPLVSLREKPISELSLVVKRIFDLALGLILLALSLPLWLAIALAVRLDSAGPVLFRQKRAGRDGVPFTMFKFRTMIAGAEELQRHLMPACGATDPLFKLPADPRITRVGRCLRRWSLDELPQLLNVVLNDMSFVGPRPEETKFTELYDIWQRRRLKVKPGITGLQQVTCRGSLSLAERVKNDIYYVRKRSLLMDILILLRTIPVVFSGHGAF